jgi:hypothetical protein
MRKRSFQICAFTVLLAAALHAQDIASTWQGTFTSGAEQHRAVLQMAKKDGGGWDATAFYIEFFHDDIHIDSLVVDGSTLKLSIDGGKGAYEGKIGRTTGTRRPWNCGVQARKRLGVFRFNISITSRT